MPETHQIMPGLTFAQYRAISGVNWSSLKHYAKSPAHYRSALENPQPPSDDLRMGSALHALLLEGAEALAERFAVSPEGLNRRTKEGKESWAAFAAENRDKDIISVEQADAIRLMAAAVAAHPAAARLLACCREREVSIRWEDPATGMACKARLDGLDREHGVLIDLKTAKDASPKGFARAAADLGYHGQAAFYLEGLAVCGIEADCVFLVVEKTPPFAVALYHIDGEALAAGRRLAVRCLDLHACCVKTNEWPGYDPEVRTLILPGWALQD